MPGTKYKQHGNGRRKLRARLSSQRIGCTDVWATDWKSMNLSCRETVTSARCVKRVKKRSYSERVDSSTSFLRCYPPVLFSSSRLVASLSLNGFGTAVIVYINRVASFRILRFTIYYTKKNTNLLDFLLHCFSNPYEISHPRQLQRRTYSMNLSSTILFNAIVFFFSTWTLYINCICTCYQGFLQHNLYSAVHTSYATLQLVWI